MNRQLTRLAERRRQLVAQAAAQRIVLAHHAAPWRARLALVDRGVAVFRRVRNNPVALGGAALLLGALWRRGGGKWLARGWAVWQFARWLRKD